MKTEPTPPPDQPQLLSGRLLLEALFAPPCRPSLRWLQAQQKAGRIPYYKVGQLVFFDPVAVRAALKKAGTPSNRGRR